MISHDDYCDGRHKPRQRCNRALAPAVALKEPALPPLPTSQSLRRSHRVTNPVFTPTCSRCGKAITAEEESVNEGRCNDCLGLDRTRRSQQEAALRDASPPERPWWLSPWWLGVEATACVIAIITGALMLDAAHAFPSLPGWWLAVGVALVVLGPADIALSATLWLMRRDNDASADRASLVRWLVLTKIGISVVLFPLLVFGILLLAALYAKRGGEEAAERTIDLLGGALIGAVVDRPRQRTGICALCGRNTSHEGKELCDRCAALGKRRPEHRLLYGGRLAGVDSGDADARSGYFFIRRKPGWKNYFGGWHVIVDEHDIGTLTRRQERRFEVTSGSHAVKVKVVPPIPPLLITNTIEFASEERDVHLECGRDEEDESRYRLKRIDVLPHRLDTLDPAHQSMTYPKS